MTKTYEGGGGGRPGGVEELKDERMTITLESSLKKWLHLLASRSERSLSNYVRAILWDHVGAVALEVEKEDEEAVKGGEAGE